MSWNQGGCLCGAVRYAASSAPVRVTYCHCKFCQRATGSAYLVEPIFQKTHFTIISGKPATYTQASEGSGRRVTINFCSTCGTFSISSDFQKHSASMAEHLTARTGL